MGAVHFFITTRPKMHRHNPWPLPLPITNTTPIPSHTHTHVHPPTHLQQVVMQRCCRQQRLAVCVKASYASLVQHILLTDRQQPRLTHKAEHQVGVKRIHPA